VRPKELGKLKKILSRHLDNKITMLSDVTPCDFVDNTLSVLSLDSDVQYIMFHF
jgi:hypothetical protein